VFHKVGSKADFPEMEQDVLRFWKGHAIFDKSVEARQGGEHYTFYEGPPTANGSPGVHHVLSRLYKDVICRYKTMKGYHVPRKAGWDTHGLPVELEVESSLALTSKAQIEEYGVARFNDHCRQSAFKYIKEWEAMTERLGCWLDMEHPYITLDNSYIESCWWIVKKLWDRGLIYQGYKVTPHCPRCGTSLSSHEVALGYDEADDPSIWVKFKLDLAQSGGSESARSLLSSTVPAYLLAWTTTPWTLPGNTALAVAPEADYAVVEVDDGYLILADALLEQTGVGGQKVVGVMKGSFLVGLHYEPLYSNIDIRYVREDKRAYRVIEGDFVSMEDGTGIVHIAPAYGEIDFEVGERKGLPLVHTVELDGMVTTNLVTGFTPKAREYIQKSEAPVIVGSPRRKVDLPGAGRFVKDADKDILDDLKSRGLLFRSERITHTYPFCWRCRSPLLYYAKQTWYIRTTAVKEELVSGNAEINWYPDYIKHGRFGDWLENNVDWAFSRERYWGTPLNIWCCESCGNPECVGSVEELKAKPNLSGADMLVDLHRPYMDEITFPCSNCGGQMRRVPEVIDCWFDSGAMPIGQWHYPFENRDKFEQNFPADFVCEAVDQTRGWFYSLHAISTLLLTRPCFRNVICLGHVVDACGEKMSKSKGNVVDPWTVIKDYGADALRWYMLASVPGENVHRFATAEVARTMRDFLSTLWNTLSFFTIYANIDHFVPQRSDSRAFSELDDWITSAINQLIADVTKALDEYNPTAAARQIGDFVRNLSNWYVRRSRRRFWKSEEDADKSAAYNTLYQCLVILSRLLAPFTPFIAEELYQNLVRSVDSGAEESVHLTDYPIADGDKIVDKLSRDIELVMEVSSLGRAARAGAGIKVRQPLAKAMIGVQSKDEEETLGRLAAHIREEINVKQVEFVGGEFPSEMSSAYSVAGDAKRWVATSTELTPELIAEGMSREIVRRLQNMRRAANLDIADYIVAYYQAKEPARQAVINFGDYIKQETLCRELIEGSPPEEAYTEKVRISQCEVVFGVKLC
jgi:isoleucyl-tRNA synthetase